jgi:hypothetical protein
MVGNLGKCFFVLLLSTYLLAWQSLILVILMVITGLLEAVNVETLFRWRGYAQETEKWRRSQYSAILLENVVAVIDVHAEAAIIVEANGDEEDVIVFDVGNGQLFWIRDHGLQSGFGNGEWPCNHFEIVASADGLVELGVRSLGGPLSSIRKLSVRVIGELPGEQLLAGSLAEIDRLFKLSLASVGVVREQT